MSENKTMSVSVTISKINRFFFSQTSKSKGFQRRIKQDGNLKTLLPKIGQETHSRKLITRKLKKKFRSEKCEKPKTKIFRGFYSLKSKSNRETEKKTQIFVACYFSFFESNNHRDYNDKEKGESWNDRKLKYIIKTKIKIGYFMATANW